MRRIGACCALALLSFLTLAPGGTPSPSPTSAPAVVLLRLVSQPTFRDPQHTTLPVRVRAVNDTAQTYDDLSIGVSIETAVGNRTEYESSLQTDTGAVEFADTSIVAGTLSPGQSRTLRAPTLDLTQLAQRDLTAIYPMKVELRSHDQTVATLRSPVIFLSNPKPLAPLDLCWTFVLSAPIVWLPDGTFRTPWLQRQVAHGGPLRAEARALAKAARLPSPPPMDIAVAPQLVDQLLRMRAGYTIHTSSGKTVRIPPHRAGAANAADVLRDLREAVSAPGVELSSMPFASPSIPALIGAGLAGDLPAQMSRGRGDVASALHREPANGVMHPPGSRLDQASLFELQQNGVRRLLVDEDTVVQPPQPNGFAKPSVAALSVGTAQPLEAIVPDAGVQSILESTLPEQDPHLAVQAVLGELASIWLERPSISRGIAMMLSERTALPGYFYEPYVRAIEAAPWLRPMTATGLAAVHTPHRVRPAELAATRGPSFSTAYLAQLSDARARIDTYRSVISADRSLPDRLERDVLIAEAGQFASNEDLGFDFLHAVIDALHQRLSLVVPDTSVSERTLSARAGTIPVSILNRTGHAVKVQVELDGGARLTVQRPNPRKVNVPQNGITLAFHVQAQTTGRFPVKVVVRPPDGGPPISQGRLVVRSTAYNRVALVITAGAALFLLALWARRFVPWAKR